MAAEQIELRSVVRSRANVHHVPLRKWKTWTPLARTVFNEVYSAMSRNQWTFLHPHQDKVSNRMWKTTAWNAAWIAADAASQ